MMTQSWTQIILQHVFDYTFCSPCEHICSRVGQSAFCFFPPCTSPRWSDRGSTDPSISGCLDSLPSVHHGADPRPPSRSLHLPGGRCRCCSPPRPGEGPTGVCFSYLHFLVLYRTRAALTIQGAFIDTQNECLHPGMLLIIMHGYY